LVVDQPDEFGMLDEIVKGEAHQRPHRLERRQVAEIKRLFLGPDLRIDGLQSDAVQVVLVAEMVIKQLLVHPGPVGDLIDARAGKALVCKFADRGREQCGSRCRRVARLCFAGWCAFARRHFRRPLAHRPCLLSTLPICHIRAEISTRARRASRGTAMHIDRSPSLVITNYLVTFGMECKCGLCRLPRWLARGFPGYTGRCFCWCWLALSVRRNSAPP